MYYVRTDAQSGRHGILRTRGLYDVQLALKKSNDLQGTFMSGVWGALIG